MKPTNHREYSRPDCVPIFSIDEFRSLYKAYIVHEDLDLRNGGTTLYVELPIGSNDWGNKPHKFKARFNKHGCTIDRPPDSWAARKYDPHDELVKAGR